MDWMRRQDIKEESHEVPNVLTPEDDDECYFEEEAIDEGMVREISQSCKRVLIYFASCKNIALLFKINYKRIFLFITYAMKKRC